MLEARIPSRGKKEENAGEIRGGVGKKKKRNWPALENPCKGRKRNDTLKTWEGPDVLGRKWGNKCVQSLKIRS